MRILVTGGAGFVGSHYVRALAGGRYPAFDGAEIVVLDLLTYAGRRDNLGPYADAVRFVHGDVRDPVAVSSAMSGVDLVVHFAAESHVDRSIVAAGGFVGTNVGGTQVLLAAALDHRVDRFVHVSTDEVYGSVPAGASRETDPLLPNSPYAASKAGADLLARSYHRTHGLPVCVTRASNTYGPRQYPEKVIPVFVTRLLDGRRVPLYGDGRHVRDWLHVSDHCQGVQLVAEKGGDGEIYNVGGGTSLTNADLARRLLGVLGEGPEMVETVTDRKGHDRRYCVDWSKIADELGYVPAVPFDRGLPETVRWYADNRDWWQA